MARILTIEDEENLRFSITRTLGRAGHDAHEADGIASAQQHLKDNGFDVVLTDVNLNGDNGIDLVRRLRDDGFDGAIVVMTAFGTIENAVTAMKQGADDYLQKPLILEELVLLVDRLMEQRRLRTRLRLYQRMERAEARDPEVLGESSAWRQVIELADRLATLPVPANPGDMAGVAGSALPTILLIGDTGTGKGVLARYIHRRGEEPLVGEGGDGPFVHINCSALPPTLVESELFGHEKGAFTDAREAREGLFEMADGGTVFLDEIGDMPTDLQAKLLTVLERGVFRRVGGKRDRYVRARIIAASNQDLDKAVEEKRFRRDLLYRLNAFTVRIPPLRERGEDAVQMAEAMLERFAREYGRQPLYLTDDARRAIRDHSWPGNVRELVNVMQRVAMLGEGSRVGATSLGLAPAASRAPTQLDIPTDPGGAGSHIRFDFSNGTHTAEEVEKELIVQALHETHGNVSRAAKLIGMQRSSFRYRIERFDLEELVKEIASR